MAYDRFIIAPIEIGLETDVKPFLLPETAFAQLSNAYVFRGRLRKRFGSLLTGYGANSGYEQLHSRLRIALPDAGKGITDADGTAIGTVPGLIWKVGQIFSIGDVIFTVVTAGADIQMLRTDGDGIPYNLPGGAGVGITDVVTGDAVGTVTIFPGPRRYIPNTLGAKLVIGADTYEVTAVGAPAALTQIAGPGTGTGTFDTTTGDYTFTGCELGIQIVYLPFVAIYDTVTGNYSIVGAPPTTQVYFYPAEPVMGISQYEVGPINYQPTYAFDTQFAYTYAGGAWEWSGPTVGSRFHGNNSQFFWTTTWTGINKGLKSFFVTNFNATVGGPGTHANDDTMWVTDGAAWAALLPKFLVAGAGNIVQSARIIIPFKDRLLLLNTIESDAAGTTYTGYSSRCRFSHNGSPFSVVGWLEPNEVGARGGGYIDAPTEEKIISAEYIKDRLIVYFDTETRELVATGNNITPFVWMKINTELGSQSTFSTVPFDKAVLTIGQTGIHACTGGNVQRIDDKIPNKIFQINNANNGTNRVAGVRDYYVESVYWSYPSTTQNATQLYPDKILVYNYKNKSWSENDDCITAFGYFEYQTVSTWANTKITWKTANYSWSSGSISAQFKQIVGGNQEGYIFIIAPDVSNNAPVMQLTDIGFDGTLNVILTVVDNNLAVGDYIKIVGAQGATFLDDVEILPGGPGDGETDAFGAAAGILPPAYFVSNALGAKFIIGTEIFTISSLGLPAAMSSTGAGSGTYNTTTGEYAFTGCTPGLIISFMLYADYIFKVKAVTVNTVNIGRIPFIGTYMGGGTVARVSNIDIATKFFNPYVDKGKNVFLAKVDFYVKKTSLGQITVDSYPSSTDISMLNAETGTDVNTGSNILDTSAYPANPLEKYQDQLWHPLYFQVDGDSVQLYFYFSDDQMKRAVISESDFELDAMVLYTLPVSRLQ